MEIIAPVANLPAWFGWVIVAFVAWCAVEAAWNLWRRYFPRCRHEVTRPHVGMDLAGLVVTEQCAKCGKIVSEELMTVLEAKERGYLGNP